MIDYLTLMLISMTAGLAILAYWVVSGINSDNKKAWIPGFVLTGFINTAAGLHMTFTWPIVGSFNIAFGEMSVLFGVLFLGAAIALWLEQDFRTVAIYAFFAGLAAVVVGARIMNMGLTKQPLMSGIGFILTGAGGLFAWLCCLAEPHVSLRTSKNLRLGSAIVLLTAAAIWAITGYGAYWSHLESFMNYAPGM
jgi:putative membrane protein